MSDHGANCFWEKAKDNANHVTLIGAAVQEGLKNMQSSKICKAVAHLNVEPFEMFNRRMAMARRTEYRGAAMKTWAVV
jgi:hypothetical protein